MKSLFALTLLLLAITIGFAQERKPRSLDEFSHESMLENGETRAAAPQCKGQLGWIYHKGFCYMFTSYHETFHQAQKECEEIGGYLADVLTQEENEWIKSVLDVINPKDGTDYWLGAIDTNADKAMTWVLTGNPVDFNDFVPGQPDGNPYLHSDFDLQFAWNAKNDANDQDNGFICKRPI